MLGDVDFVGLDRPEEKDRLPSDPSDEERFFQNRIRLIDETNPPGCFDRFRRGLTATAYGVVAVAGIIIRAISPWKWVASPVVATAIDFGSGAAAQLCLQEVLPEEHLNTEERIVSIPATPTYFILSEAFLNTNGSLQKVILASMRFFGGAGIWVTVHSIFTRTAKGSERDELTRPLAGDTMNKLQVLAKYDSRTAKIWKAVQLALSGGALFCGYYFPILKFLTTLGYIYGFDVVGKILMEELYSVRARYEEQRKRAAFIDSEDVEDFTTSDSRMPTYLKCSLTFARVSITAAPLLAGVLMAIKIEPVSDSITDALAGLLFGMSEGTRDIVFTESDPASLHLTRNIEPLTTNPFLQRIWTIFKWSLRSGAAAFFTVGIVQGPNAIDRACLGAAAAGLYYGEGSIRWLKNYFKPTKNGRIINSWYLRKIFAEAPPYFAFAVIKNMHIGDASLNRTPQSAFLFAIATAAYFDLTAAIGEDVGRDESEPPKFSATSGFAYSHLFGASVSGRITYSS